MNRGSVTARSYPASAIRPETPTTRKLSITIEPDSGDKIMKRLDPVHPGEVLKHDFMEPLGLSAAALAKALGVTSARINEIVRGGRGITAETALRLARYFNTDARSWMSLQNHYDLEVAERVKGEALRMIRPREAA